MCAMGSEVRTEVAARTNWILMSWGRLLSMWSWMALASPDRVIGVVLLCAHPRNALYVENWIFMCSLRGSKMGRLEAVLGQFRRCWGHEVPFLRCFGQIWPRNAI